MDLDLLMESDILENAKTEDMVTFIKGEIPLLITVPHGGTGKPHDIDMSRCETRGYKVRDTELFNISSNPDLKELALRLADRLNLLIGRRPYVVAALFDRRYVDANRNDQLLGSKELPYENHAYDQPAGKKYFDKYHGKIRQFISDIRKRFNDEGLLFDIHGSLIQDNRIVVGMVTYDPTNFQRHFRRGHVSVDQLISRHGFDPIYHPATGFISALQNRPLPGNMKTEVCPRDRFERSSPSGGFTVISYGSHRPGGINAFQLECSKRLLDDWQDHTLELYAKAIQTLYRRVLDGSYTVETVFAGKHPFESKPKKAFTSAPNSFVFSLSYPPHKSYPATVIIHTQRLKTKENRVLVNDNFLGVLEPAAQVSIFHFDNKGWGKLRKDNNNLSIIRVAPDSGPSDDFIVTKVDIIYCRS